MAEDPESRDYYCEVIMDEAGKMNKMVKQLLTLTALEFGNDKPVIEQFDLTGLIHGVLSSASILLQQKEAEVEFEPSGPVMVWADEFKIEEVITNYLNNAMNHLNGKRKIKIRLEKHENEVTVFVFNTGNHIPEEDLDKLWTKFYKVDKAHTREYGGSGIGLSIVKAIMDSHHKACGVRNAEEGVEFWFTLDCSCSRHLVKTEKHYLRISSSFTCITAWNPVCCSYRNFKSCDDTGGRFMKQDMIVILDLGSTENTVLAREIRAMGVYSEIYPHDITAEELKALPNVKGVVIYGGPNHIVDGVRIDVNEEIYSAGYPVMSIDHEPAKCQEAYGTWEEALPHLRAFVFDTCHAEANWNMKNFVEDQIELIRRQVGDKKVLLALSGGVDSSVVAALLIRAIGKQLVCVHVNHGLMRKGESESVIEVFKNQMDAT